MAAEASPERSSTELEELERLLRLADGFVLAFVRANVPVVRDRLARELAERLILGEEPVTVRILRLADSEADLLDEIDRLEPRLSQGEALFVFGLEAAIPAEPETSAGALERLNRQREAFRELPGSVVFFLPEYALTRLAREAPDLWAWRSGVFETDVPAEDLGELAQSMQSMNWSHYDNLDRDQKRNYKELFRGLLAEIERAGEAESRLRERLDLRLGLAELSYSMGEWEAAEESLRSTIELAESADAKDLLARSYHLRGIILQERGCLGEAENQYCQALGLLEELGNRSAIAASYHQLGILAQLRGSSSEALEWFYKSLDLKGELEDLSGRPRSYHHLGMLAGGRGSHDEALDWYRKSLDLAEDLGDRSGMAASHHQLGVVGHQRGSYDEALDHYRKSLAVKEELGDRRGIALSTGAIGAALTEVGQVEEAVPWNLGSLTLRLELGMPSARFDLYWLARQREALGPEQFESILDDHLDPEAKASLLKMLDDAEFEEGT